jgi:hypothetical protein
MVESWHGILSFIDFHGALLFSPFHDVYQTEHGLEQATIFPLSYLEVINSSTCPPRTPSEPTSNTTLLSSRL